jgi:preprotein translocase subunit YajC
MIQFFGIHIGTLYFPTSILLITLLVLVGFIIYFLSRRKRNRDQTIQSNENRVKGKRGKDKTL